MKVFGLAAAFSAVFQVAVCRGAYAAEAKDALSVSYGGFIDTYYLFDFDRPPGLDRTLSSGQPYVSTGERSNEFNVNLAFVEAKVSGDRVRGRLALQAGTSVAADYRGESNGLGVISGPLPMELVQEAVAGYRISDGFWVDAGIFFAHMGFENFVSRDNWNYTRSLIAEFSPYYESGVKVTYQVAPQWSAQFLILNGWQNIFETNTAKSVGLQLSYAPSDRAELTYNNYFGNEPGGLARFFNELIARITVGSSLQFAVTIDEGTQVKSGGVGSSFWYGAALLSRWQVTPSIALGARLERYVDRDDVIVPDVTPNGFAVSGGSLNLDIQLHKNLLWRNEARLLLSDQDAVFTGKDGPLTGDKFLVSSLGLSF